MSRSVACGLCFQISWTPHTWIWSTPSSHLDSVTYYENLKSSLGFHLHLTSSLSWLLRLTEEPCEAKPSLKCLFYMFLNKLSLHFLKKWMNGKWINDDLLSHMQPRIQFLKSLSDITRGRGEHCFQRASIEYLMDLFIQSLFFSFVWKKNLFSRHRATG